MPTMLKTDKTLRFDTSSPTAAATTTTLAAAVTTTGQTSITLSASGPLNGTYIQIGSEKMLVTSGGGSTALTVTRGAWSTTASTYTNGTTVNLPGHNTYTLLPISQIPNREVKGGKVTTDINYQVVVAGGSDTFPGGGTSIVLADNTPERGTLNLLAPGSGTVWLQFPSAGAAGASGSGSTPSALQISPPSSTANQGDAYKSSVVSFGGVLPYTFAVTSGSLPTGLSLNTATGAITGTPTTPGTSTFTVQVTDAASTTASVSCSITVKQQTLANFTIGTINAAWDSARSNGLLLTIPVSGSPSGVTGGHLYYEIPDQSSFSAGTVGNFVIGTSAPTGAWGPIDGPRIPVTAPQPWQVIIPVNASNRAINPIVPGAVIRVYVQSYSAQIDPAPIQAGLSGATPSATVTVPAQTAAKAGSGVEYAPNIASITAQSGILSAVSVATAGSGYTNGTYTLADTSAGDGQGATITVTVAGGVVTAASVATGGSGYDLVPTFTGSFGGGTGATFTCTITLTPDNSTGKLYSPVAVTADLSNLPAVLPGDFAYELVGVWDTDPTQTQIILTGWQTASGLVPSGPDTIRTPHSVALETPSTPQWVTIYARSMSMQAVGKGRMGTGNGAIITNRNTIVPGVTPSARVRIGVTSGTVDQSQSMPSKWGAGISGGAGVVPRVQVTVANASAIIDALAIVDANIGSTGLPKLIANGPAIFTSDAIFSRGTGNPLVDLASTGMFLFSTASAGSGGGDTTKPYVNITSSQVALFSGGSPSLILTSGSVTSYAVSGSTASPYVSINSGGVTVANSLTTSAVVIGSGGVTVYSVAGSTSSPYVAIASGSVTVSDGSGSHSVVINSSGVTITGGILTTPALTGGTITGSKITIAHTSGSTVETITIDPSLFPVFTYTNSTGAGVVITMSLASTGFSVSDNFGNSSLLSSSSVKIGGVQVVGARQTGPGSPSGFADATAQAWCLGLYNALKAGGHGLVN
jgi:large repetitive protein